MKLRDVQSSLWIFVWWVKLGDTEVLFQQFENTLNAEAAGQVGPIHVSTSKNDNDIKTSSVTQVPSIGKCADSRDGVLGNKELCSSISTWNYLTHD